MRTRVEIAIARGCFAVTSDGRIAGDRRDAVGARANGGRDFRRVAKTNSVVERNGRARAVGTNPTVGETVAIDVQEPCRIPDPIDVIAIDVTRRALRQGQWKGERNRVRAGMESAVNGCDRRWVISIHGPERVFSRKDCVGISVAVEILQCLTCTDGARRDRGVPIAAF